LRDSKDVWIDAYEAAIERGEPRPEEAAQEAVTHYSASMADEAYDKWQEGLICSCNMKGWPCRMHPDKECTCTATFECEGHRA